MNERVFANHDADTQKEQFSVCTHAQCSLEKKKETSSL